MNVNKAESRWNRRDIKVFVEFVKFYHLQLDNTFPFTVTCENKKHFIDQFIRLTAVQLESGVCAYIYSVSTIGKVKMTSADNLYCINLAYADGVITCRK